MILLLFDAHKLDISDEFKRTIEARTHTRIHTHAHTRTHISTHISLL